MDPIISKPEADLEGVKGTNALSTGLGGQQHVAPPPVHPAPFLCVSEG